MKEGQEEIYYIVGTSLFEALRSPYLEAFRKKDYEVLVLLDDIDDFIFSGFEYKGKKMKSITKGDMTLNKEEKEEKEKAQKKYEKFIDLVKDILKDDVKDVRLSARLTDTVCCLVTDEGDLDPQMEKLLKSMGQELPPMKRVLEINPTHPLFASMNTLFEKDKKSATLEEYVRLLYDQALVLEGSKPKDPGAFSKLIAKLMVDNAEADAKQDRGISTLSDAGLDNTQDIAAHKSGNVILRQTDLKHGIGKLRDVSNILVAFDNARCFRKPAVVRPQADMVDSKPLLHRESFSGPVEKGYALHRLPFEGKRPRADNTACFCDHFHLFPRTASRAERFRRIGKTRMRINDRFACHLDDTL